MNGNEHQGLSNWFGNSLGPGERLAERYEIIRTLGAGTTGIVLLVEDRGAENNCLALKVLYPHLVADPVAFGRFRAESLVTMKLAHPNILPTYGLGFDDRGLYFQKQFYNQGMSLREYMETPDFQAARFEDICSILYACTLGLRFAHESGVIHRDIKPENILLSGEGEVRVSDFGLSHLVRQESGFTLNAQLLGTPYYMSPEQIQGEVVDTRSDIYSFGIMSYELIHGDCPFQAKSFFELAEQHLEAPLPTLSSTQFEVPLWFIDVVHACTAKKREARISSMRELAARFSENLDLLGEDTDKESFSRIELSSEAIERFNKVRSEGKRRALVIRSLAFLLLVVLLYLPRLHTVHWRLTAGVLWLERQFGVELEFIRAMYHLPLRWSDEDVLFSAWDFRQIARPLLRAGANPNRVDPVSGLSPLHAATHVEDYPRYARVFRDVGANLEILDAKGRTALYYAVELSRPAAVEELLRAGVDPNNMGDWGETPLHLAVRRGRDIMVRLLLAANADPNIVSRRNGKTALEESCELRNARVMQSFSLAGYNCDMPMPNADTSD